MSTRASAGGRPGPCQISAKPVSRFDYATNAGTILDGLENHQEVGRRIFDEILAVVSGKRTKAELLGHRELVVWKVGPVL